MPEIYAEEKGERTITRDAGVSEGFEDIPVRFTLTLGNR